MAKVYPPPPAPLKDTPGEAFHDGDSDKDKPESWDLYIESVDNGYIVNGSFLPKPVVFEVAEDAGDTDPQSMARLLRFIIDYFGESGSRYDAARVRVVVEPGDKHGGGAEIAN